MEFISLKNCDTCIFKRPNLSGTYCILPSAISPENQNLEISKYDYGDKIHPECPILKSDVVFTSMSDIKVTSF